MYINEIIQLKIYFMINKIAKQLQKAKIVKTF